MVAFAFVCLDVERCERDVRSAPPRIRDNIIICLAVCCVRQEPRSAVLVLIYLC
jgi:hypothetical protein